MRTVAVALIIWASAVGHTAFDPGLLTRPEVVQGTPLPITFVATEDCPDVAHCDN